MSENIERKKISAIYILPNLLTTAALLCGFSAVLTALDAYYGVLRGVSDAPSYTHAVILVFIAMIFDGMDGRVARWSHSESAFGVEYDSLSDLISFGVAPAVIIYLWSLKGLSNSSLNVIGNFAWFGAYLYLACTALRLARFNVQIGSVDKRFFVGMPSPTAASIVMGFVWFCESVGISGYKVEFVSLGITLYAGCMMVTNVPFYSFKAMSFRKEVPFYLLAPLVVVMLFLLVLIIRKPGVILFICLSVYALSGPAYLLYLEYHKRERKKI